MTSPARCAGADLATDLAARSECLGDVSAQGAPAGNERIFYGWFIVGILFVVSILDGGFAYIFSAFLKPLSQEFGWTRAQTAGAFSLYLLAAGLTLPLWGWIADRKGARLVFLSSTVIDGGALLLLSCVGGLKAFYLFYFSLGVGLGGIGPATVGKVISLWFVAKRGRAMAVALIGTSVGGVVLVPLAGYLIGGLGWRFAYRALAAVALGAMLPLIWFFLTDTPEEIGYAPLGRDGERQTSICAVDEPRHDSSDWTLAAALRTSTFWLLGLTFGLGLMAAMAVVAHQVAFLQDKGLTLESASSVAGVLLGMNMAGRFFVGWATEHARQIHRILALCLTIQAIGIGLSVCLDALGLWAVTACLMLFGVGAGGLMVLWPLTIAHDFGIRAFGAIAGALGAVGAGLGGAAGPVLVGALYDSTGSYSWAFLFCSGALLIGAGAAFFTDEPGARSQRDPHRGVRRRASWKPAEQA